MDFNKILYLFFVLFLSNSIFAKVDIGKLKDRVTNQSNKLNSLAAQIKDIDYRIGHTNNNFLINIKKIEEIEKEAEKLKSNLSASENEITSEFNNVQLAFDHYLLEKTEEEKNQDIQSTTIHFELLSARIMKLSSVQKHSKKLLEKMNVLESSIANKKKEEQEIYNLIVELENKKKDIGKIYVDEMENHNQLQGELDKLKASKIVQQQKKRERGLETNEKSDFKFSLPVENFIDAKRKKKGIIFKYSSTIPVIAPGSGKVVYVGALASYGKVVIIDHGKDVRSVLFGDIVSKVDKNAIVKESQIIGYTMGDPGAVKSVYYEVRKKNIVQNTMLWLSEEQLKTVQI